MFTAIRSFFKPDKPDKELYIYVITFNLFDKDNNLKKYMKVEKRMSYNAKQNLRRKLQRENPDLKVRTKSKYIRYCN